MNLSQSLEFNETLISPTEDVWAYLMLRRGMRQTNINLLASTSAVYISIFAFGFIGNFSLLWLIFINRSFHTPTNYYLVNLSVSDLLVLVLGLPHDLYLMWYRYPYLFGETGCRVRALLSEASMISSVLTITALTVERYLAICHPLSNFAGALPRRQMVIITRTSTASSVATSGTQFLRSSRRLKNCCAWSRLRREDCLDGRFKKIRAILCFIWIISIACSLPLTMQMSLSYLYVNESDTQFISRRIDESSICTVTDEGAHYPYPVLASFIFFFVFPLVLIAILYIRITRRIYRSVQFTRTLQETVQKGSKPSLPTSGNRSTVDASRDDEMGTSSLSNNAGSISLRETTKQREAQVKLNVRSGCLNRQTQQFSNIQHLQNEARIRTNKSLIKMLICIVIAFFTCFAPFHAERLLVLMTPDSVWVDNEALWWGHEVLYHVSGICLFANSVVNPILYNIMSRRMRSAFKTALSCHRVHSRIQKYTSGHVSMSHVSD